MMATVHISMFILSTEYQTMFHFISIGFFSIIYFWVKTNKNKKYHTVGTVPKSKWKIVEKGKIDTSKTQIYMTDHFAGLVHTSQL